MTLPTIAELPYAKTPKTPFHMPHKLEAVAHAQARLRGRYALVPDLDLAEYRFRAVINWIQITIQFRRGVQIQ